MPVERTRSARIEGNPLEMTWKVEPASSNISFATNLTPSTFNDPMPPLVDRPEPSFTVSETTLFPPIDFADPSENEEGSTRTPHSRKKPPSDVPHIPRPPNAFILFRASFIKQRHVSAAVETSHSTLSTIIGLTWQGLPDDEREAWHGKARAAREAHKRKWPAYAFKPTKDTSGTAKPKASRKKANADGRDDREKPTGRRKIREVGPTDHKRCSRIAQLLVEGKKGADLDKAISEFDKTHVPEVVTRFEEVVTAGMYEAGNTTGKARTPSGKSSKEPKQRIRRSSSVPIIEIPQPSFLQYPSSPAPRKLRASSSQPSRVSTPSQQHSLFSAFSFPPKELNTAATNPAFGFSYFEEGSSPHTAASSPAYEDMSPQTPCSPEYDYVYTGGDLMPCSPLSIDTSFNLSSIASMDYPSSYPSTPCTPYSPYFQHGAPYYDANLDYYEPSSPFAEAAVPSLYDRSEVPLPTLSSAQFSQNSSNGIHNDVLSETHCDSAAHLADALSLFQSGLANAQAAYDMSYQFSQSAPNDFFVNGFDMGCPDQNQKDGKTAVPMDLDLTAFLNNYGPHA